MHWTRPRRRNYSNSTGVYGYLTTIKHYAVSAKLKKKIVKCVFIKRLGERRLSEMCDTIYKDVSKNDR